MTTRIARTFISEHILEVRFLPDPHMLDRRGSLAAGLSRQLDLPEWQIDTNRIDVFDKDQTQRVFVSFKNLGMVMRNASSASVFQTHSTTFLQLLARTPPFHDRLHVQRIGVRYRAAFVTPLAFPSLIERFTQRVAHIQPQYVNLFGGRISDIGVPLHLETAIGTAHVNSGPMQRDQLKTFFQLEKEEDIPEIAVFADIDQFVKPDEPLVWREIATTARQFTEMNWEWIHAVADLVLE